MEVLAETGNMTAAAQAVGARWSSLNWRRKQEPEFDRQCAEAAAAADERLRAAKNAFEEGDGYHAIQRTSNGRYQLTAVRPGGWTKTDEEVFFTYLRRTGNIAAAARAAGFDESSVWDRFYKWTAFAARWEQVLDETSLVLEFRLACEGNQVWLGPAGGEQAELDSRLRGNDGEGRGNDGEDGSGRADGAAAPGFDREFALRFLKWREEKKAGGRNRGRAPRRPPIEEVAENVIRKVEAIKRHRKLREEGGEAA